MGYLKIKNLYADREILDTQAEVYALEKIHGTSAHILWKDRKIFPFSGGAKHEEFLKLFDFVELENLFLSTHPDEKVCVYGEACGGKLQGMSKTYGDKLRFVVFDIKVGDTWLNVEHAQFYASYLGLDFVWFDKIKCTIESIDSRRDAPSYEPTRIGSDAILPREGVVLRPIIECRNSFGDRLIAKHKREEFRETKTPRDIDGETRIKLETAKAVADEWVTEMRLNHVLDKIKDPCIEHTGQIISLMVEDIRAECVDKFEWTKEVVKELGKRTAVMWKNRLRDNMRNNGNVQQKAENGTGKEGVPVLDNRTVE